MKFKFKDIFSGKIMLQIYFVFFIFLNVIDFLNIISGDLDFFKKILSWLIIAYIFYKVSLSKIFIGKRIKNYDLALILSFCLFTIPKALFLYVINIRVDGIIPDSYVFSGWFLQYILNLDSNVFVSLLFVLGIFLTIILSVAMLLNYEYERKSFLGSFNLKENYLKYVYEHFLLSFFLVFFGLIIFNFFMEWFALAVDALILVIGLFYYLFVFIHNHGKGKISYVLQDISNAGNSFYKSLIEMFSDKKTIFIGISFLLTLHLLVDIGVYLVPYTIGTQNTLYFDSLGSEMHEPLFNLFNFSNSRFASDLSNSSVDGFLIFGMVLVYLISLFGVFCMMFLPFYIFYKNMQKREIRLKKYFSIFMLSSIVFIVCFKVFLICNIFNANIDLPIDIGSSSSTSNVRGVDIFTSTIFSQENASVSAFMQLMVSISIFFIALIFLLFRYEKYKYYFDKIIFVFVLLFFVYYIFIFYTSTVGLEYVSINENLLNNEQPFNFTYLLDYSENTNLKREYIDKYFTNSIHFVQFTLYDKGEKYDFISGSIVSFNNVSFSFGDDNNLYTKGIKYDFEKSQILSKDFQFIYYVGNDKNKIFNGSIINRLSNTQIEDALSYKKEKMTSYLEIIRFIFSSLFYVLGTIAFVYYFVRRNILR